uniref:Zinc finger homeobox protein 3 n=1 Tax=Parascaris univalens TaxID=6257 RepID=A0A914ZXI9_PARUN
MRPASVPLNRITPTTNACNEPLNASVPFEGVYRQWGSVVVVSECGGVVDATAGEDSYLLGASRIERLILIGEHVVLQWSVLGADAQLPSVPDPSPHFFCLRCRLRFSTGSQLMDHVSAVHPSLQGLFPGDTSLLSFTTIVMCDSSVSFAEPIRETMQLGCAVISAGEVTPSSMEAEHIMQRNFVPAEFNARSLQHVPMNLTNGASTLSIIGAGELDAVASSSPLISAVALTARNSSKTLKCPKCNWHYKYHETLEIHMKEKHAENEVRCIYCVQGRAHPRLARGESYSCGYKPYRCELCKYSTTTKGNLSIHMQSDKHLHAVQEMPAILSGNCGTRCSELDSENTLQCLVCSNYSSDSVHDMVEHIEKDRSRPVIGDMSILHGVYQCNLCPYSTNLKANFQLHTRTDKHLQRVQMMNHVREGGSAGPSAAMYRLGNVKSAVQVRCRACQEILSCASALREHCEANTHVARVAQMSAANGQQEIVSPSSPQVLFECRQCSFETTHKMSAIEHMNCHAKLNDLSEVRSESQSSHPQAGAEERSLDAYSCEVDMNDAAYCCSSCDFLTKTKDELEEHSSSEHADGDGQRTEEQCPLCPSKSVQLRTHLAEEHKIAEQAIQRLLMGAASSSTLPDSTSDNNGSKGVDRHIYRFRCTQCCLAFRSEQRLASHSLYHAFRANMRCSQCERSFRSAELLRKHITHDHSNGKSGLSLPSTSCGNCDAGDLNEDECAESDDGKYNDPLRPFKCDLCRESFTQKQLLLAHYNSLNHLHRAKKILEQQPNNFHLSVQMLAALELPTSQQLGGGSQSYSSTSKPFKCNICKLGYGQGSTLDIHVRSVAHQSRLSKIAELVAQGELDPTKPLLEQPGTAHQKTIAELLPKGDIEQNGMEQHQQQSALAMLNMFGVAQLLSMASAGQTTSTNTQHVSSLANLATAGFPPAIIPTFGTLGQLPNLTELSAVSSSPVSDRTVQQAVDDERTPRSGVAFRKMLETYGFDVVKQFNECVDERRGKLDALSDEALPEICRIECSQCSNSFSSIWVLKAHYEQVHNSMVPVDEVEKFAEKLRKVLDEVDERKTDEQSEAAKKRLRADEATTDAEDSTSRLSEEKYKPEVKRVKEEGGSNSSGSTPRPSTSKETPELSNQLAMMGMMGFPFMPNPFMPMIAPDFFANPLLGVQHNPAAIPHAVPSTSPAKRARTRITDEQLKILRQYFDINNSPSEKQIKEMSVKAQLPEKVIKHWFRNTLFKERQRDKDSPYNFNVPPQMSIDLDTYEKTGETKITSLKVETNSEDCKATPSKTQPESLSVASKANTPAGSSQLIASRNTQSSTNPFVPFLHDDKAITSLLQGIPQSNSVSGRRANRTRFTDFQLRTLQQFFDKQAYPKDDDLEVLSKKLQLSPRVIVVWFQNARQKARKIYENQPSSANDDRFMKTPGSNFQCKRCQLVFQRYYELIQHQQKLCYKDDCAAQQKDNKGVEENLSEDEKSILESENGIASSGNGGSGQTPNLSGALAQLIGAASSETGMDLNQADFLKLLTSSKPSQDSSLKLKLRDKKKAFYKRCPFCCLLFHSRESLVGHIPARHPEQLSSTPVNVDLLPDAEDVPTITTIASEDPATSLELSKLNGSSKKVEATPLDLSCSANGEGREDSVSMSPSYYHSDNEDNSDNVETCDQYNSSSPGAAGNATQSAVQRTAANSKRYRTHLTPLQVHVMKSVFAEYKTPSMSECDMLGAEIGLHKRVVQVWFQNARAKERKTRAYNGEDEMLRCTATRCEVCGIDYNHRLTLHDHIFTSEHLSKVKKLLRCETQPDAARIDANFTSENNGDKEDGHRIRMKAVRDRKIMKTTGISLQNAAANPLPQFPYNFIYGLQPGLAPMIYDPNVMGTPIPMLQIPESVMAQITTDMSAGRESTKFTQDGKTFQQLIAVLPLRDFQCAGSKDSEVGWACPQCTNVFQQEVLLKSHQRLICQNCDSVFKLIQTHYECRACSTKLGTQAEFKTHCEGAEHQEAREVFLGHAV